MPTQISEPGIAATVKRCRADRIEKTLTDSKAEGLILRVTDAGTSSWLFRYRFGGRRKNITIGRYPAWGIADAREKARALRRAVDEGVDVAVEKQRRKHEEAKSKTVADVAQHYFDIASRDVAEPTLQARRKIYEKYIDGTYGRLPVGNIKPSDVAASLRTSSAGGPTVPPKVAGTWGLIFKVAVGMGLVGVDPSRDISTVAVVGKTSAHRERVALTDEELPSFLRALSAVPRHYELGIRLLLLTGVRVAQLTEAKVNEFDLDAGLWRIPHEHRKNRRHTSGPHEIPLPDEAVGWVRELITMADKAGHLYPVRKLKNGRDTRSGKAGRGAFSLWLDRIHQPDWRRVTPHDLRATCKTAMTEIRIEQEVRDRYLDHAWSGMDSIYNKGRLLPQLRAAGEKLFAHYNQLETGKAAKIIRIA